MKYFGLIIFLISQVVAAKSSDHDAASLIQISNCLASLTQPDVQGNESPLYIPSQSDALEIAPSGLYSHSASEYLLRKSDGATSIVVVGLEPSTKFSVSEYTFHTPKNQKYFLLQNGLEKNGYRRFVRITNGKPRIYGESPDVDEKVIPQEARIAVSSVVHVRQNGPLDADQKNYVASLIQTFKQQTLTVLNSINLVSMTAKANRHPSKVAPAQSPEVVKSRAQIVLLSGDSSCDSVDDTEIKASFLRAGDDAVAAFKNADLAIFDHRSRPDSNRPLPGGQTKQSGRAVR